MKKYIKISAVALTCSMLISVGSSLLYNNTKITQAINYLPQGIVPEIQGEYATTSDILKNVEFFKNSNSNSRFAIVRDALKGDRVYAWGNNTNGELGTGDVSNKVYPTEIKTFWTGKKITNILCGLNFTLIVLDNTEIWATGINDHGQFGNNTVATTISSSFKNSHTFSDQIFSIVVGDRHVAVLTSFGLYTWGDNRNGQLGLPMVGEMTGTPTLVETTAIGRIRDIKSGNASLYVWASNNTGDTIYICGNSTTEDYLGVGNGNIKELTLLKSSFTDNISNIYTGGTFDKPRTYVVTSANTLYVWGMNNAGSLGSPSTSLPVLITLPFKDAIKDIFVGSSFTLILTDTGSVYSSGAGTRNGISSTDISVFTKIPALSNITRLSGALESSIAITTDKTYAWGINNGSYGTGTTVNSNLPVPVQPFGSPSEIEQILRTDTITASAVVGKMFPSDGSFVVDVLKPYINLDKFPSDAIFSMSQLDVAFIDGYGTMRIALQPSVIFSTQDGVKTPTIKPFIYTLDGFKVLADSKIANKPLPSDNLYNFNNIVREMVAPSTTISINRDAFDHFFTDIDFPSDNSFSIITNTIIDDVYYLSVVASRARVDALLKREVTFNLSIKGLVTVPDSVVENKVLSPDTIYNLNNIKKAMKIEDTNKVNMTGFNDLFNALDFPSDNEFIILSDEITNGIYQAQLYASKALYRGNLVTNRNFPITISGLKSRPDSNIINKPAPVFGEYNLNNIVEGMKLNGTSEVNMTTFDNFFETSNFPVGNKFTIIKNDTKDGIYHATINASKYQLDGYVKNGKDFELSIAGLQDFSDSAIINIPLASDTKYNMGNIVSAMKKIDSTEVNLLTFSQLFTTTNFPAGNKFTILSSGIENGIYKAKLNASNARFDGYPVVDKTYDIEIKGLKSSSDSFISYKTQPTGTKYNLNNIVNEMKTTGNNDVNMTTFNAFFTMKNFPLDTIFSIIKNEVVGNVYNGTFKASKALVGGWETLNVNFDVSINDLPRFLDSRVTNKMSPVTGKYNLNNIKDAMRTNGTMNVNMNTFNDLLEAVNFPTYNVFTIVSDKIENDVYKATLSATKSRLNGYEVDNKTFDIVVDGLVENPNSRIMNKTLPTGANYNLNNIINAVKLNGGVNINPATFNDFFATTDFPADNTFTILESKIENQIYKATLNASKSRLNGNTVENKPFAIFITGLTAYPDSVIENKQLDANTQYNLNNIANEMRSANSNEVNMQTFNALFTTDNFQANNIFTIVKNEVNDKHIYELVVNASNAQFNGYPVAHQYELSINMLITRPDSFVHEKTPPQNELERVLDKIKPNEKIDIDVLNELIQTGEFPDGTSFTINTVNPNEDNTSIEFTFTPDKIFKDGNVVSNSGSGAQTFDANVKFVFPVELVIDYTWLIVGVSVGGSVFLLLVIGLLLWYLKYRSNKNGKRADKQSVLF